MTTPAVSIIIPVFNQWNYTRQCLKLLQDPQITSLPVEVVVVDNCSTDETPQELRAWAQRWPALRVERLDQNTGFSPASNHGARVSSAPLLLFLNNDTEPTPGWLEPLVDALKDPSVGIVGPKLIHPDGTINHGGYAFRLGAFSPMYTGYDGKTPGPNKIRDYQALLGACLLMRRELFFDVGEFSLYGLEDVDLCLKVRERGLVTRYLPTSTVIHHGSVTLRLSTPGSFPVTDGRGFAARWAQYPMKFDEHAWYLEDGEWPWPTLRNGMSAEQLVRASMEHLIKAYELRDTNRPEEALFECIAAESEWASNPFAYILKCSLLVKLGRRGDALREFSRNRDFLFYSRLEGELMPSINALMPSGNIEDLLKT